MPYHANEELCDRVEALRAGAGERMVSSEIGRTVEGRSVRAATVAACGRAPDPSRPQALLTANIHGNEAIGSEVALGVLELLAAAEPDGAAAELLDLADVTVAPAINLDSRARAVAVARAGSPGRRSPRSNARGVDLNRNFPFPDSAEGVWHPLAGTKRAWMPWYRGPQPLSEPESQALAKLCERLRPTAAIALHSVGELFLYPYCYKTEPPKDLDAFLAMGEAFVAAQPARPYRVRQSRSWYAILGDLDDWLYDTFGTLAVTVELSRPLAGVGWNPLRLGCTFAWMNPRDPAETVALTRNACVSALAEGVRQRQAPLCTAPVEPGSRTRCLRRPQQILETQPFDPEAGLERTAGAIASKRFGSQLLEGMLRSKLPDAAQASFGTQQVSPVESQESLPEVATGGIYKEIEDDPTWGSLTASQKQRILADFQANPQFRQLASGDARDREAAKAILQTAARRPDRYDVVLAAVPQAAQLFRSEGYQNAPENVRRQVRDVLAQHGGPGVEPLNTLVGSEEFAKLSAGTQASMLAHMAESSNASDALERLPIEDRDRIYSDLIHEQGIYESDPEAKETQQITDIMKSLDPHTGKTFLKRLSNAVQDEIEDPNLAGAIAKVSIDPGSLVDALEKKANNAYAKLLREATEEYKRKIGEE